MTDGGGFIVKRLGRWAGIFVSIAICGTSLWAKPGPFPDVPIDHWAYDAVEYLASKGFVEGYPDGEFKGDRTLTRYEYAMIIARMERKLLQELKEMAGPSAEILSMIQQMKDEFSAELDDIKAKLASHEMRLEELESQVGGLTQRTSALEQKVEKHEEILAALKKIDVSGSASFGYIWGQGQKFNPTLPDFSQSDVDFSFALALHIPIAETLTLDSKVTTLGPLGTTNIYGGAGTDPPQPCPKGIGKPFDPLVSYNCITYGKYDIFRTGDYRLPSTSDQTNKSFDLNEAYITWTKDWGNIQGTFWGGKFNPHWFSSPLFFNPYIGYEGLGAIFNWKKKWNLTLVDMRTEDFTQGALPSLNDTDLELIQLSSENRAVKNLSFSFGWVFSNTTDLRQVISESPETFLTHLAYRIPYRRPLKIYAAFASNGEEFRGPPNASADYADDIFANSWMIGVNLRKAENIRDWALDVNWKDVGLNTGLPGYFTPDTKFLTATFSYRAAKNTLLSLRIDSGTLGDNASLPREPTVTTFTTGVTTTF